MAKREWYVSWFNTQDYLDLYRHRDEHDARKIVSLIFKNIRLKRNSNVLDLACGNGRHSLLFAKTGMNVIGIDLSRYLISQAKKKLKTEYKRYRGRLKFEIKDMRDFSYPGKFELIVNIFTSFGYFEKDADNEKVIGCVSKSLKNRGHFVLDFLNKEYLRRRLVPYSINKEKDSIILQLRKITDNFVTKEIMVVKRMGSGYELKKYRERIKLYSLNDFKRMFKKYKLKILKVFGDYEGKKYDYYKSPRLILIAQLV